MSAAHKGYYTEIIEEESRFFNTLSTFVLLPIWRFTERDGNNKYLMNAQTAAIAGEMCVDEGTRKATLVRSGLVGVLACLALGALSWFVGGGPQYLATHESDDPMNVAVLVFFLSLIAVGVFLVFTDLRRMNQVEDLGGKQFSEQKFVEVHEDVCRQSQTAHNIKTDAHKEARAFWKSDTPL